MRCPTARPMARRGLTLVELLVTIALMLLIMSIIVAVFTAATDGMSTARTDQQLSSVTRRIDTVLRQDLRGATARFTPPLDPNDGLGYFEYGENSFADAQGEDTDDYLAFTAKAPPGQPFTGRIMLQRGFYPGTPPLRPRYVPTTITSEFAEIIYFLRNGNLYRRVLLVVPDRKETLRVDLNPAGTAYRYAGPPFNSDGFNLNLEEDVANGVDIPDVSWQGANDVSVRPPTTAAGVPIPNTLGDLTNRHNRAFRPRFTDDYVAITWNPDGTSTVGPAPDGQFDDRNRNGVPDYYPTLTAGAFVNPNGNLMVNDPTHLAHTTPTMRTPDRMPFPFLFPGAYSKPIPFPGMPGSNPASINLGPYLCMPNAVNPLYPLHTNHSPLDLGDNLLRLNGQPAVPITQAEQWTWWGFPTWAETRALGWNAPTKRLNWNDFNRPIGVQAYGLTRSAAEWLPQQDHWYAETSPRVGSAPLNVASLQDDLLASNVRSFDIKALDPYYVYYSSTTGRYEPPRYDDLGYAAKFKLAASSVPFNGEATFGTAVGEQLTFGHEGRIPPLVGDNRFDPQAILYLSQAASQLGDNSEDTVRMRRVWDSWSTDYMSAPIVGIDPFEAGPNAVPPERPMYPSYPPPYPSPLRGIQIQIRLAAPDGSRPKVLTIRQDFMDKL